jgi:CheY-like chemotaxis protein
MPTTVLVADDDAAWRAFVAELLTDEGYAVVQAPDGAAALEHLRQSPTGLVALLDLHMPQMSGFDVLRVVDADAALRQRHAYLVLSSAASSGLPADFLPLVARHSIPVFTKPCDLGALLAAADAAATQVSPHR